MKDPMKSRDKITQKMSRDGADRAKPDHGRKRAYQQAHTGRGFSENAGAASRTGRGAASRGAFHVLSFAPCAGAFFKAAGTQPPSASWSISARDRPGKPRKKLSGERRKRQRQRRSRPVCNLPTRRRATPELEKYIKKSDKAADRLDAARGGTSPKEEIAAAI